MCHREVRIELNRALEVRHRLETRNHSALIERERVRMQRVERARRRLRQRSVEPLDERQRFAKLFAKLCRGGSEQRQDLLFGWNLDLFARQDFAGFRVDRFQREDVVASEAGDGAGNERLELLAPGNLARDRPRDALVGRALHQTQGLSARGHRGTP